MEEANNEIWRPAWKNIIRGNFCDVRSEPFHQNAIVYAVGHGVPMASVVVPMSGVLAFSGGLSILLGYKAKYGAWLLVLFLVPVTVMMHRFWELADPTTSMAQQVNFMKNLSMLGAALLIAHFGSGP